MIDRVYVLEWEWCDYDDVGYDTVGIFTDIREAYAQIPILTASLRKQGYSGRRWPDIDVTTHKLGYQPVWTEQEIIEDMELHFSMNPETRNLHLDENGKLLAKWKPRYWTHQGVTYIADFRDEDNNQLVWRQYYQGVD